MKTFAQFDFTPEPHQIQEIYESGFVGATSGDGLSTALFRGASERLYDAFPLARGLYKEIEICLPIRACQALIDKDFNADRRESQRQGDCLLRGTMVYLPRGKEKPIEQMRVGDVVLSANNVPRKVTAVFKKPYSGKMIKLHCKGMPRTLTVTPDHRLIHYPSIRNGDGIRTYSDNKEWQWDAAGKLTEGSRMRCSFGVPESGGIHDPDLAWLIGIYLAEGCVNRTSGKITGVSFCMNAHRHDLHDEIRRIVESRFDYKPRDSRSKSNPNTLVLGIYSVKIGLWFNENVFGDCYTKKVPDFIFGFDAESRAACIRGWCAGDGYLNHRNNMVGVTASPDLKRTMHKLCVSLGLETTVRQRRQESHQTVPSHEVLFGAYSGSKIGVCEKPTKCQRKAEVDHGLALPIDQYDEVECEGGFVYCIEVEEDHSFIANGYAVANCVGKQIKNQGMVDGCIDALFGETTWKKGSDGKGLQYCDENIYGDRGHGGEGADCWRLWNTVTQQGKEGFLFRERYETSDGVFDLSNYNPSLSGRWGRGGTPNALAEIAAKNPALRVYKIKSIEEALDALALGFGLGRCGSDGYSNKRNEDGFSDVQGSWAHAIAVGGFDRSQRIVDKYGIGWLHYHDWGQWNSGPKTQEQPEGSWWVRQKFFERWIRAGSVAAVASVVGLDRKLIWEKSMDRRSFLIKEGVFKPCVS